MDQEQFIALKAVLARSGNRKIDDEFRNNINNIKDTLGEVESLIKENVKDGKKEIENFLSLPIKAVMKFPNDNQVQDRNSYLKEEMLNLTKGLSLRETNALEKFLNKIIDYINKIKAHYMTTRTEILTELVNNDKEYCNVTHGLAKQIIEAGYNNAKSIISAKKSEISDQQNHIKNLNTDLNSANDALKIDKVKLNDMTASLAKKEVEKKALEKRYFKNDTKKKYQEDITSINNSIDNLNKNIVVKDNEVRSIENMLKDHLKKVGDHAKINLDKLDFDVNALLNKTNSQLILEGKNFKEARLDALKDKKLDYFGHNINKNFNSVKESLEKIPEKIPALLFTQEVCNEKDSEPQVNL